MLPPPSHKHAWRGGANPQGLFRLRWPEREEPFSKGALSPRLLAFQLVLCSIICRSQDKVPRRREELARQPGLLSGPGLASQCPGSGCQEEHRIFAQVHLLPPLPALP